jgi:TetR/AcrR family transcriptional regulator, transcriptional repressor for nem operon
VDTKQQLLQRATETVRRGGSAALNFRDLGRSVGVKSSTVHYYFPTKSDLLNEIAGEYKRAFIEALDDGVRTSKSLRQDLLVLVDLFMGAQGEKLSCLCGMLATEADLLNANVKTAVNLFFAALQEWVVRLARRPRAGDVRSPARLAARGGIAPEPAGGPQVQPGGGQGVDPEDGVIFLVNASI